MYKIDKRNRIPAYVQLMNILIEQIKNGAYAENDKLPTERGLCELYGISRSTVRQAVRELELERYINVEHGRGIFVAPKRYSQNLLGFYSFTKEMKKLNKAVHTKVISFEITYCDKHLAQKMRVSEGTPIYAFQRLRFADNEPVMLVKSCVPCPRFPDLCKEWLESGSLYEIFIEKYGVQFTGAEELIDAVAMIKDEAKHLEVKAGFPGLRINRTTFEEGRIIEYSTGLARGDRFTYNVVLK